MIGEMNNMEIALIATLTFFTMKGIISLFGFVWLSKKIRRYIEKGNKK